MGGLTPPTSLAQAVFPPRGVPWAVEMQSLWVPWEPWPKGQPSCEFDHSPPRGKPRGGNLLGGRYTREKASQGAIRSPLGGASPKSNPPQMAPPYQGFSVGSIPSRLLPTFTDFSDFLGRRSTIPLGQDTLARRLRRERSFTLRGWFPLEQSSPRWPP